MEYRNKLNPERSSKISCRIKGTRQKIIVTHNLSEIDQNQLLVGRFPNSGSDNVIILGTTNLSSHFKLDSTDDKNRMLLNNIGRAIVKKFAVKFEGNEILNIDDFNVFVCYRD